MEKAETVKHSTEEYKEMLSISVQALAEALHKISDSMLDNFLFQRESFFDRYLKRRNSSQNAKTPAFLEGRFTSLPKDHEDFTSLSSYCDYLLEYYKEEDKKDFLARITKAQPICHSIDRGLNFTRTNMDLPSFKEYVFTNAKDMPEKLIQDLSESLEDYQFDLINEVTHELIRHFSLDGFGAIHMENALEHVKHFLNNSLLPRKVQKKLKKFAFRYFLQMLNESFYYLDLLKEDNIIEELLRDFCYEVDCMYLFEEHVGKEKNYPRKIFACYKAYELFDHYARKINNKPAICFLYRKMFEKDALIYARDTQFRNWFNAQEYLVQLENHTDTYSKSHTEERCAMVELLYKNYGLS